MGYVKKAIAHCGLVLLTGPLCFTALAQDYVDLEAERAAAARKAVPADPYGERPPPAYPAPSYGANRTPAYPSGGSPSARPLVTGGADDQSLGRLFYQIQQLQQEVMRLNGIVEEQSHELRQLSEQSLQRYVDLDKRVGALSGGAVASTSRNVPASRPSSSSSSSSSNSPKPAPRVLVDEQPGEGEAYRAAYALVRDQRFEQAVGAFQNFIVDYPSGKYAPNAHYWLGELFLVVEPQDLESSRQSFMLLLNQYPDNSKIPDAMYKLGKVYFLKGNRERAREFLDRVISEHGSSNSSAVKLAKDFIAENY